jgi:hydroxyacylglutathione hydrolase
MAVTARSVPILKDNYAWLLRDTETGATAIVDPAEGAPIIAAIEADGGRLDLILLTHHHGDHIADTDVVRAKYPGVKVVGASADAHRLPKLDQAVKEGDTVTLGHATARVIETPGHTRGQINYFFAGGPILLSGDTLFSLGCGRLIEGNATEMFSSLSKLAALPDDTLVCCGHEYTEANAKFALSVDPDNVALRARAEEAHRQRAKGEPTIPSRLGDEKRANPFLLAKDAAALADVRGKKDRF